MMIRLATESDLGAMTWVLIGASPLDPVYPYRFPDRHLYADEFAELCRQKCAEYLATSTVVVCEMESDTDPGETKVVAFSAWDAPHYTPQAVVGEPLPTTSTTNPLPITIGHRDRMNVFRSTCAAMKRDLFDARYRSRGGHMFLKMLLCHPEYQRRGAGRALASWGIAEARRQRLDTTVFASPMGFALYRKLGFREVARFRVQLDGEEDYLEIPAMVLRAEGMNPYYPAPVVATGLDGYACTTTAATIACK